MFVFFKQKTAYEMRISDWSSDVCSSDLVYAQHAQLEVFAPPHAHVVPWRDGDTRARPHAVAPAVARVGERAPDGKMHGDEVLERGGPDIDLAAVGEVQELERAAVALADLRLRTLGSPPNAQIGRAHV